MQSPPKGVGRSREFDHDAVTDAAVDVFWRRGFAATTTRVLESELGMTQSSVYSTRWPTVPPTIASWPERPAIATVSVMCSWPCFAPTGAPTATRR